MLANFNYNYKISFKKNLTMKKALFILALLIFSSLFVSAQTDSIQINDTLKTRIFVFDIDKDLIV